MRFCLRPSLILILRLFFAPFLDLGFGLASFFGRRGLFFGGGDWGAFFFGGGGAFFGGGGGAFFFGGGGGFLPLGGGGGGGGGGFFAIPNAPCKQRVPLKKSGK